MPPEYMPGWCSYTDPELRKRFSGNADHVVNFFKFITEELREIMAELGFRTVHQE